MIPHSLAQLAALATPPPGVVDPTSSPLLYLLGGGGGLGLLALIVKTIVDLIKGHRDGQVARDADMKLQRDTAWKERDDERAERIRLERVLSAVVACERRNSRRVLDYASKLRRLLSEMGVEPPPEPELEDCDVGPLQNDGRRL